MMEETVDCASDSNEDTTPPTEIARHRYSTDHGGTSHGLGATSSDSEVCNETSRLEMLEREQEQLNSSLMSLTTHFAQVQFRLKQIISSPEKDKEHMLKDLEEFAFRGCPDMNKASQMASSEPHAQIIEAQRAKQRDLIDQLKNQLADLESYAYQAGDLELPSLLVMEKQKVIIDELKEKINLPLDDLNKLSNDELKNAVDNAICQMVNPAKLKEQLCGQLKTQIQDLERFIDFLQGAATSPGPYGKVKSCGCPHTAGESAFPIFNQPTKNSHNGPNTSRHDESMGSIQDDKNDQTTVNLLKRMLSVMQIFAVTQMGCGSKTTFEKNTLKKSTTHWGDLRANLEVAVTKVIKMHMNFVELINLNKLKFKSMADESDDELKNEAPHELIRAVRKDLACSLRDLMQHGLVEVSRSTSLVPFGCFVVRSKENYVQLHVWDLLMKYYEMKHGKDKDKEKDHAVNTSASSHAQTSFNLNVSASGRSLSIKQSLLNAIDTIIKIHKNDLSNKDSCFKAFVCLALNEKKLVLYLKQLLKTSVIIENNYQNWSYIKSTGFDDSLKSLDQLKMLHSNLPVEKSMRRRSHKEPAS